MPCQDNVHLDSPIGTYPLKHRPRRSAQSHGFPCVFNRLQPPARTKPHVKEGCDTASLVLLLKILPQLGPQAEHGLGVELGNAGFGIAHDLPNFLHGKFFIII